MLPEVDALFTLVRQVASRSVPDVASQAKCLVQRHGLGPLLATAGHHEYREDLARSTLAWRRIELELPAVVAALAGRGVRVACIKGSSYARELYAFPAERPMSDVDLLVPHEHVDAAVRTLERLGFTRGRAAVLHHAAPWVRGDLVIDLHWSIVPRGRANIDLTSVWARMHASWPEGGHRLEPNDALLFHLLHLVRNRMLLPLINVIDYTRLAEKASIDVVLRRADEWATRRAVTVALQFFRDALDHRHVGSESRLGGWFGPTHDEVAALEEPTAARKIVFDLATAESPREVAARVVHVTANRGVAMVRRMRTRAREQSQRRDTG